MNLLLLPDSTASVLLPADDPRAVHIRKVLRFGVGDRLDVGCLNGPRGKGLIASDDASGLRLEIAWGKVPPPPAPLVLALGMPRPQTARKILQEGAALGVAGLAFFNPDKGEKSYADASLWTDGEARRLLWQGVEQAFSTHLPTLDRHASLDALIDATPGIHWIALDNYESPAPLHAIEPKSPCGLILGPERGFSPRERDLLRARNIPLAHLGPRVLRAETAATAAAAIMLSRLGAWESCREE